LAEVEGTITHYHTSILIHSRADTNYIARQVVDECILWRSKHKKSCLAQIATCTKRKVTKMLEVCLITMNEYQTQVTLNMLPLVLCDGSIVMD